jgi:hypothetical protein
MEIFLLRLPLANNMDEMASLELVARGVAMNAMKKGGMPEAFEKPPIASTKGSEKMAAMAAPAIKYSTALVMICVLVGRGLLSLSPSSSSSSSCEVDRRYLSVCSQETKVGDNLDYLQYKCQIKKLMGPNQSYS